MPMIYVAGYPKHIGGANTELWHTLQVWRQFGIEVSVIPTWPRDVAPGDPWLARLEAIGVQVVSSEPEDLHRVDGLPGATVVSFCNTRFLEHASIFQGLGCPIVWVGCMCWMFPKEKMHYREHPSFERYVFQSQYQRDQIEPQLGKVGYIPGPGHGQIIHGCFHRRDWPPAVLGHDAGSRFTVGRLSREGVDKFPVNLISQYKRIPYPTSARVMGWSEEIEERLGAPPNWFEAMPESTETAHHFVRSIHAMVPGIGCCRENWPRVGLEAMATGVPIVAENCGGWPEMLGENGLLADSVDEQSYMVARLAYDRQYRMSVIVRQWERLDEIANPEEIAEQWKILFASL